MQTLHMFSPQFGIGLISPEPLFIWCTAIVSKHKMVIIDINMIDLFEFPNNKKEKKYQCSHETFS